MNSNKILACPACKGILTFAEPLFSCPACKKVFSISGSCPDFLGDKGLVHKSKREEYIRTLYAKVYTPVTNFMFLFCGGAGNARREVLERLEVHDNDTVLETGMGAGENLQWIRSKVKNPVLYGIDIQAQMIKHCLKNMKRWNLIAEIFRADAEGLPFRDEVFDVVFHLGAINLFADKKKAIDEMIRVAKPGTRLVIADETDKAGRFFNMFTGSGERIVPPVSLIPSGMLNIKMEIIWRGYGYVISFTKPFHK